MYFCLLLGFGVDVACLFCDASQELAGKNNEIHEETSKVRMDLNRRIEKLEAERQSKGELYDQISVLEKELSGESDKRRLPPFRCRVTPQMVLCRAANHAEERERNARQGTLAAAGEAESAGG